MGKTNIENTATNTNKTIQKHCIHTKNIKQQDFVTFVSAKSYLIVTIIDFLTLCTFAMKKNKKKHKTKALPHTLKNPSIFIPTKSSKMVTKKSVEFSQMQLKIERWSAVDTVNVLFIVCVNILKKNIKKNEIKKSKK